MMQLMALVMCEIKIPRRPIFLSSHVTGSNQLKPKNVTRLKVMHRKNDLTSTAKIQWHYESGEPNNTVIKVISYISNQGIILYA